MYESARRPTMKEFSKELTEWLKIGTKSLAVNLDLSTLARECQGVFEPAIVARRNEDRLIQNANFVLTSFDPTLERMKAEKHKVTNYRKRGAGE
jgi:hypothetical protein